MRIALFTHRFAPDVGGIEAISELLAREFVRNGQEVRVITRSLGCGNDAEFPFEVVRAPSAAAQFRAVMWADVVLHNNISVRFAWPLLFLRRPWVVAVHTWIRRGDGRLALQDRLKHWLLRYASVISVSRAIAEHLPVPSEIIPNSYRDDTFRLLEDEVRVPGSLAFVGRLVSDKGVHVLLDALHQLATRGLRPSLSIIGEGPERNTLERRADALGLSESVRFLGAYRGEELARALNRHDILVVPSLWDEPFGIVALEGIACGCVVVASERGGLPEAVGPGGVLVPNGDGSALAHALQRLLADPPLIQKLRVAAMDFVAEHGAVTMGERYLRVLKGAARHRRHRLIRSPRAGIRR